MNPMKAAYCRIYQRCLWLSIPLLPYRRPKLFYSTSKLTGVFEERGIHSVLVITDPGVKKLGLINRMLEHFDHHNIRYLIYDKTVANPTIDNVEEARDLYIKEGCQALIGFGGGSSMDCAKAVGARIARPDKTLPQMRGILKVRKKLPLLIAVPTTAGTGSETTLAAVVVDPETRHKYAINDFPLIPEYAVLDPKITVSLPPFLTASTGMDALTHAVEAYIGKSVTRETAKCSLKAVQLIFGNIYRAYDNGKNMEARENMSKAACLAGCAFTKSYVGYIHAVAHSLGGRYNIPHGYANAVLLPIVLEDYGPAVYGKLRDLAVAAGIADPKNSKEEAALRFIQAIKEMKKHFHFGDTFPEIREEDIPEMAAYADKEANPLYPVPVLMDAKSLSRIYYQCMVRNQEDDAVTSGEVPGKASE